MKRYAANSNIIKDYAANTFIIKGSAANGCGWKNDGLQRISGVWTGLKRCRISFIVLAPKRWRLNVMDFYRSNFKFSKTFLKIKIRIPKLFFIPIDSS